MNVAHSGAVGSRGAMTTRNADLPRNYLAAGRQAIGDTVADLCRAVASSSPATVDLGQRDAR